MNRFLILQLKLSVYKEVVYWKIKKMKHEQFYTKYYVNDLLVQALRNAGVLALDMAMLDPFAGNGKLARLINMECSDLDPVHPDVIQKDFFEYTHEELTCKIMVSNPPFKLLPKKSARHLEKAQAPVICFVIPSRGIHRKPLRDNDYTLHWKEKLPIDSFETRRGKDRLFTTYF